MRVFYDAKSVVSGLTGGLVGGPDVPGGDDDAENEAAARAAARAREREELRNRRGRSSTLVAGRAGGGLASTQIGVRRSTLGGA